MRAILIVYDEPEEYSSLRSRVLETIANKLINKFRELEFRKLLDFSIEIKKKFDEFNILKGECHCIRNGSFQKAKALLKYLRKKMNLPKENVTLLRTSRFYSTEGAEMILKSLILKNPEEDLILFYAGHGNHGQWHLGSRYGESISIRFFAIRNILDSFRGRLILFNECCHALSINQFLYGMRGRYLLFGASRSAYYGDAFISPINFICSAWQKNKIALPRVGKVKRIISSDNKIEGNMDIAGGNSCVTKLSTQDCPCGDIVLGIERVDRYISASLRIGSNLDYLCFPK